MRFRASGGSMRPAICDGDLVTVAPGATATLVPGNVVVYRNANRLFAHRVVSVATGEHGVDQVITRGDAAPRCDAPVTSAHVVGELVEVRRGTEPTTSRSIERFMSRMTRIREIGGRLGAGPPGAGAVPRSADAAIVQQVQSGTATNSANGTQTVTISSIDTTKSFLVFQTRSTGDRPVNTTVRGRLASATTIEFERSPTKGPRSRSTFSGTSPPSVPVSRCSAARPPCRPRRST